MATYAAGTTAAHVNAGKTLLEIIWEDLDRVMDLLMEEGEPSKGTFVREYIATDTGLKANEWWDVLREWGEQRGQAQGLAYAIAVLTNPYHVDVDAVRTEAVARWRQRQEEQEEEE